MTSSTPDNVVPPVAYRNDRLIALFLFAVVAFTPPLLRVFGQPVTLMGWPVLFVYIFVLWGGVVALIAIAVESRDGNTKRRLPED